jgi:hypothetical protein
MNHRHLVQMAGPGIGGAEPSEFYHEKHKEQTKFVLTAMDHL